MSVKSAVSEPASPVLYIPRLNEAAAPRAKP